MQNTEKAGGNGDGCDEAKAIMAREKAKFEEIFRDGVFREFGNDWEQKVFPATSDVYG